MPSAALEITDSSRGILIPRMTLSQRTAIANPAESLMIYQTDSTKGYWYFDGTEWRNITSSNQSSINSSGSGFTNLQVFNTAGVFNWVAPIGITKVMIEAWGGGASAIIGGGTSGCYGKGIYNVTPNQIYLITVGSGGLYSNPCSSLICYGENTSFDNLMTVEGGGIYTPTNRPPFYIDGGKGIINLNYSYINHGGNCPNGGEGGINGGAGTAPGGGGCYPSGNGAVGRLIIWY